MMLRLICFRSNSAVIATRIPLGLMKAVTIYGIKNHDTTKRARLLDKLPFIRGRRS
jgi:hypothetical protein